MQKSDEGKKAKTRLHPYSLTTQVSTGSASYTAPEVCPQLYWTARILSHEKVQSSVMVSWLLTSVSAGGSTTVLRSGGGMPDLSGSPNKGAPTFSGRAVFYLATRAATRDLLRCTATGGGAGIIFKSPGSCVV